MRCTQLGLSASDLDNLSTGMVLDMFAEAENDQLNYAQLATKEDFKRFKGL